MHDLIKTAINQIDPTGKEHPFSLSSGYRRLAAVKELATVNDGWALIMTDPRAIGMIVKEATDNIIRNLSAPD